MTQGVGEARAARAARPAGGERLHGGGILVYTKHGDLRKPNIEYSYIVYAITERNYIMGVTRSRIVPIYQ